MAYDYEGLIPVKDLIKEHHQLDDETIVRLKKLELDYLLARIGLQGTLWGAWASLAVILILFLSPMLTRRDLITGWQIVVMVSTIVVAIVFYGTFIFQRALAVSATTDRAGNVSVSAEALLATTKRLEGEAREGQKPKHPLKTEQSKEPITTT